MDGQTSIKMSSGTYGDGWSYFLPTARRHEPFLRLILPFRFACSGKGTGGAAGVGFEWAISTTVSPSEELLGTERQSGESPVCRLAN